MPTTAPSTDVLQIKITLLDTDPPAGRRGRDRNRIGCHSFRATGHTDYLANGGTLETAAALANHA